MLLEQVNTAIGQLRGSIRKSTTLIVNSGALAVGTLAAAVLGFAYWWLAARFFPPEAVGRASALLSVVGLAGVLSEAGIGTLLIGENGPRRSKGPQLVSAATLVGLALALGLALAFVIGQTLVLGPEGPINGWIVGAAFFFGCGATVVSMLFEDALIGNLNSVGRMVQQVLFSLLKLALIAAAVVVGYVSNAAILLTWVASLLASWIVFDLLSRGGTRRLVGRPDFRLLYRLRRETFDHYALDVALQAPGIIMPFLVLVLLSPATTAAFALLWMLVTTAAVIPAVAATALFPVVRSNPDQAGHNILVSLFGSLLVSLAGAVVILVYSQEILAFFNPAYPDIAGSSLRLLGFSLLGLTLKYHACALARLNDRMRTAAYWFAIGGLLEVCLAVAGAQFGGLQGLVLGWTLAVIIEGACAAAFLGLVTKLNAAPSSLQENPAPSPLQT